MNVLYQKHQPGEPKVRMHKFAVLLTLVTLAGCIHTPDFSSKNHVHSNPSLQTRNFTLVLQSDPSGAEVHWPLAEGTQSIGVTPLKFVLSFVEQPSSLTDRIRKQRDWLPDKQNSLSSYITPDENGFVLKTPELSFQKKGFRSEKRALHIRLTPDLLNDREAYERAAIRREMIIMRSPTQPQITKHITIDSTPSGAAIHAIDSNGKIGDFIGTTPYTSIQQFSARKNRKGDIVGWHRWAENKDRVLWRRHKDHTLWFTGVLLHDDYEPEFIRRPVTELQTQQTAPETIRFLFSHPAKPQHLFTLQVDTLPSAADVYLLQPDNTLGQRIGATPFEIELGIAQKIRDENGNATHSDWLIWGPTEILDWIPQPDGTMDIFLACALYKEGYALEQPGKPILSLQPNSPLPESRILTIPLLRPEQAAVREARRTIPQAAPAVPSQNEEERRMFIWQAPENISGRGEEEVITIEDERTPSLWERLRPKR